MSLETGTYISDLVASNPAATDAQSQGDDHIRLLKSVLQATLPNGSKAFRFPADGSTETGAFSIVFPTDQNKTFRSSTGASDRLVNLPVPSGVNAPGWQVTVVKVDSGVGRVQVSNGTINGAANYYLVRQWEAATFIWNDTLGAWIAIPHTPEFASTTAMLFVQTAAPVGWTKDSTHNNKALRVVTGTASSGGTTAFTSVFANRTILKANLPSYNLTVTDPGHAHDVKYSTSNDTSTSGGGVRVTAINSGGANTGAAGAASDTTGITVASGGSGTAMDFAVQYVDVIIATKD